MVWSRCIYLVYNEVCRPEESLFQFWAGWVMRVTEGPPRRRLGVGPRTERPAVILQSAAELYTARPTACRQLSVYANVSFTYFLLMSKFLFQVKKI